MALHSLNWHDIYIFTKLVEHQTLSATAVELQVQHSTVARRIQHLENTLRIKLFERIGKRYLLTTTGKELYQQACTIANHIDTFKRLANDADNQQGQVSLSAPPLLIQYLIAPYLVQFYQQYPQIELDLKSEKRLSDLHRKQADIALRLVRPQQQDLIINTLTQINYYFFCHTDETMPYSLIGFTGNQRLWAWLQSIQTQTKQKIIMNSNDFNVIKAAILQKIGIGILPSFMVNAHEPLQAVNPFTGQRIINENLSSTFPITQQYPLYMVLHPEIWRLAKTQSVINWLKYIFH